MAHFTTDLPDWKTWRNLNENKELAEDKAIELYKKLLLAQTVMIEESLRQINTHNEALINAQGGSAGAGAGAGAGAAAIRTVGAALGLPVTVLIPLFTVFPTALVIALAAPIELSNYC